MKRSQTILLILIILAALVLRIVALNDPVTYDEGYTYVAFASHGWRASISDYSLPNNHVFHTALVWACTGLLGNHPWALRLPALLAGLALVAAIYALGRRLYSPETGLVAAALAAWFPELVRFSTDARGYSLIGLFTVLVIIAGWEIAYRTAGRRSAATGSWVLLSVFTALGFWTIPLMLYPAGALYLWLALELLSGNGFMPTKDWLKPLLPWFYSGFGAGILTLLLYVPVLFFSGWRRLVANGFVQPVEAKKYFNWVLADRLADTWATWTRGVPPDVTVLLVIGFVLALVFHRRISSTRWPQQVVVLAWVALLVLARRPEAFDRFWSWLIAPCLLWAAAGWVEGVKKIVEILMQPGRLAAESRGLQNFFELSGKYLVPVFVVVFLLVQVIVTVPTIPVRWQKVGNQQAAAEYLLGVLRPGEVVLVGYPNNAPVWYYLKQGGATETTWAAREGADGYYLLLATNQKDQTLAGILKSCRLDPVHFDLEHAKLAGRFGKIEIYHIMP
jgi:hypothetical protein